MCGNSSRVNYLSAYLLRTAAVGWHDTKKSQHASHSGLRAQPFCAVVTRALILINAITFFFELLLPQASVEQFFYLFCIVPARFTHVRRHVGCTRRR